MKGKLKLMSTILTAMNCMALALVQQNVNMACVWIFHQPNLPEEAKKFSRWK